MLQNETSVCRFCAARTCTFKNSLMSMGASDAAMAAIAVAALLADFRRESVGVGTEKAVVAATVFVLRTRLFA